MRREAGRRPQRATGVGGIEKKREYFYFLRLEAAAGAGGWEVEMSGQLDSANFGVSSQVPGTVAQPFLGPGAFSGWFVGNGVALQQDGKIVVGGATGIFTDDFALARYEVGGTLDTAFGGQGGIPGVVLTDFGLTDDARAVALQPDGKIVLAGSTNVNGTFDFALARYNNDGSLDSAFGTNGLQITHFFSPGSQSAAESIAVQSDGRVVVAGTFNQAAVPPKPTLFAVARYLPGGNLDPGFGHSGLLLDYWTSQGAFARAVKVGCATATRA